jgi:hypothetical protein
VLVLEEGVIAKTYSGSEITAENIRASLETDAAEMAAEG